ncbi:hypothetical protein V2J09_007453, partial [Rumex salicifolius]
ENVKKSTERLESRKSHSWWWESHINAKNTKWLSENMEEMDNSIGRMMKLIEDDGDSFAKKAEMYYKKRPELLSLVQEFQSMYQVLAERYAQLTGDLQKNIPDMHSLVPAVPDTGSEPTTPWFSPDMKFTRFRSSHRAAGFDVFLGSGGSASDRYSRVDDLYSVSDSEESDISSVNSYHRFQTSGEEALQEKMIQMDAEIGNNGNSSNGSLKRTESVSVIELQLKIASYEEEIANLKLDLQSVRSIADDEPTEDSDPDQKTQALIREVMTTKGRLLDVEKQVVRLSIENKLAHDKIIQLQDQLKTAKKEGSVFKAKLDSEMRKSSKWQDRITRYKASLIDRDVEIRELKDLVSDATKKYQLHDEISRLSDEKTRVEQKFREVEVRCSTLENQHAVVEKKLSDEIDQLKLDLSGKKEEFEALFRDFGALKFKVQELKEEINRKNVVISEEGELKREAIRQLCFSLDHYRNGYVQLRQAFAGHRRPAVLAS